MPETLPSMKADAAPNRVLLAVYLGLAALTWIVFGQTLGHQFVHYDDQTYVYENADITAGLTLHGVAGAFSHAHAQNWHPLTTLSHMLDCQLFGLDPARHHFTNVLLHTAAVLLLFGALRALTGTLWRSALATAIFAIHPLRAESVAWVAERKDVLSAVFFMLTLMAYVRYVRQPSLRRYGVVILLFALGLMSKPMLVTLPLLLLLLDYWPLARFETPGRSLPNDTNDRFFISKRLFLEKIPLLGLSLLSAMATLLAQGQTVRYSEQLPLAWRIGNALDSYVAYLGQMLWPARLAVFYPHTADRLPLWEVVVIFFFLAGITLLAWAFRQTRPYLFVGWSWYLICLLPVIGVIQVGLQGRADRYTYLPQIGLSVALTWAAADLSTFWRNRRVTLTCGAGVIIAALSWRAWLQTSYWKDTESLWNHALAVTEESDVAHNNVAALLVDQGKLDAAIWHYEQALRLQSDTRESHSHLSVGLLQNNLANVLVRQGRIDEAIAHYGQAVALRDDFPDAHSNLAALLAQKGQTSRAIEHYKKALAIPPEDSASHLALADLFLKTGDKKSAAAHYRRALEIAPDSAAVLSALAWALATNPDPADRNGSESVGLAEKAKRITDGKSPAVLRTLAAGYAAAGRFPEAVESGQVALRLTNDPAVIHALEQEIQLYEHGTALFLGREDAKGK